MFFHLPCVAVSLQTEPYVQFATKYVRVLSIAQMTNQLSELQDANKITE